MRWLDGEAEQAGDWPTTAVNCSAAAERTQAKEELRNEKWRALDSAGGAGVK